MKRRLVTLAAIASMVLCLAAVVLWVQSYRRPGQVYRAYVLEESPRTTTLQVVAGFDWANGLLAFSKFDGEVVKQRVEHYREHYPFIRWYWLSGSYIRPQSSALGFGKQPIIYARGKRVGVLVTVPCWFIVLITSAHPLAWGLRIRRWHIARRRAAVGVCPTCGYDLRATPDRCPECGGVPAAR